MKKFLASLIAPALVIGFAAIMCAGPGSLLISLFYQDFFRVTEKVLCPDTGKAVIKVYHSQNGTSWSMYCIDLEDQRSKQDVVDWSIALLFVVYFVVFSFAVLVAKILQISRKKFLANPVSDFHGDIQIQRPSPFIDSQVRDLLASGKKIEAIKIVRQVSQMNLDDATNYVETIGRTQIAYISNTSPSLQINISSPSLMEIESEVQIADIAGGIKPELKNKLITLIERDQKAMAIQIVKDDLGVSLQTAKNYVEKLAGNVISPDSEASPEAQLDKLRQLKKMLDENLITPAEYETKKTDILSDL